MPELPEVEIARRQLTRWLSGHDIVAAEADPTRTFRGADRAAFESLRGRLEGIERRGKYLMLSFEGGRGLLAHLGMTGKFVRRPPGKPERFSRARLVTEDGQVVHFCDARLFGRLEPTPAEALRSLAPVAALGRDPLVDGLTPKTLADAIGKTKLPLKVALMDQSRVAGLGNIHAAEALFRAGLHPARQPKSLSPAEWKALCKAILTTIRFALTEEDADEITYVEEPGAQNPFLVYGRGGETCGKCKQSTVRSFTQGGRTTYYCPRCQPRTPRKKR
jgi:formamidopyrimidine-DNA glycosylase